MNLGAHMSIADGLHKAILRGDELHCDVIQIFSTNPNQWKSRPLSSNEIERFKDAAAATGVEPAMTHTSYLINIASPSKEQRTKSIKAFYQELERAEALEIPYVVSHPGAHMGTSEKEGLDQIVQSLEDLHDRTKGFATTILLETTAGQGSCLGHRFEHFRYIFDRVREPERLGVCLDTCHIFAAGYPFRRTPGYRKTMDLFDRLVGLERLKAIHLNDSKAPPASRVDRHEHIGKGKIGLQGFRCLINDPRLRKLPMVIETPKGTGNAADKENLAVLRGLRSH